MHQYLAGIDADPQQAAAWDGEQLATQSHGESFLAVLRHRFGEVGVYFMDEPEAALSVRSCLALIALLDEMRAEGSQVIVATHSPLLVALPGAALLELGEWGIRPAVYGETRAVVAHVPGRARRVPPPPAGRVARLRVDDDRGPGRSARFKTQSAAAETRRQPADAGVPIDAGALVPWIASWSPPVQPGGRLGWWPDRPNAYHP